MTRTHKDLNEFLVNRIKLHTGQEDESLAKLLTISLIGCGFVHDPDDCHGALPESRRTIPDIPSQLRLFASSPERNRDWDDSTPTAVENIPTMAEIVRGR